MCSGACLDNDVWDSFTCIEVLLTEPMMHERNVGVLDWECGWATWFFRSTLYVE
jgi:hypothetical protein